MIYWPLVSSVSGFKFPGHAVGIIDRRFASLNSCTESREDSMKNPVDRFDQENGIINLTLGSTRYRTVFVLYFQCPLGDDDNDQVSTVDSGTG